MSAIACQMKIPKQLKNQLRMLGCCLVFAAPMAQAAEESKETFPFDEVLHPQALSQAECEAKPMAVWVQAQWEGRGLFGRAISETARGCVRYFASANAQGAPTAVFFIHGDVMSFEEKPGQNREKYEKTGSHAQQVAQAERTARDIGLPVVRIGRPGVYGSTGMSHVRDRRMPIEAHLVNAAVDAIKARHGYPRIQLTGLSGGGGLVGALLTLGRTDVDCAVSGSGAVSIKSRAQALGSAQAQRGLDQTGQPLSAVYDPIDHVDGVRPDPSRRVFVLGDPRDKTVSFASQQEFHRKLVDAGVAASLLTAEAKDAAHHLLAPQAQQVAAWCKAGLSDADIQARLEGKEVGAR
jgi:hypothetical protein